MPVAVLVAMFVVGRLGSDLRHWLGECWTETEKSVGKRQRECVCVYRVDTHTHIYIYISSCVCVCVCVCVCDECHQFTHRLGDHMISNSGLGTLVTGLRTNTTLATLGCVECLR